MKLARNFQAITKRRKPRQIRTTFQHSGKKFSKVQIHRTPLTHLSAIPSSASGSARFGCSPIRESLSLATSSSITFMSGYSISTSWKWGDLNEYKLQVVAARTEATLRASLVKRHISSENKMAAKLKNFIQVAVGIGQVSRKVIPRKIGLNKGSRAHTPRIKKGTSFPGSFAWLGGEEKALRTRLRKN